MRRHGALTAGISTLPRTERGYRTSMPMNSKQRHRMGSRMYWAGHSCHARPLTERRWRSRRTAPEDSTYMRLQRILTPGSRRSPAAIPIRLFAPKRSRWKSRRVHTARSRQSIRATGFRGSARAAKAGPCWAHLPSARTCCGATSITSPACTGRRAGASGIRWTICMTVSTPRSGSRRPIPT